MLENIVLKEIKDTEAKVSVVMKDLVKNEWLIKFNENRVIPSASTIKILIMVEALNQVQEGTFSLDEKIKVKENDKVDFSIISELKIDEYTFLDLITLMIITSDNTATNILIDLLGYEKINQMANILDLKSTVLQRKMMDFQAAKEGKENLTSAIDMGIIMEKIYDKSILTEDMCRLMNHILSRQTHRDSLPRYIEDDIVIAHKTGELDKLNHDIGIFYVGDVEYLLGIFVTNADHNLEGKRIIGRISKAIYDMMIV